MTSKCTTCGLESTLEGAFQQAHSNRRRAAYCPTCLADWHAQQQIARLGSMAILLALGVAGYLLTGNSIALLALAIGLVMFFDVLLIPFHELAHAVTALIVRMRLFNVCIGSVGRIACVVRIFGCDVVLRTIPAGGSTLIAPRSTRWFRLRNFAVVLAAPLLHIGLIGISLFAWQRNHWGTLATTVTWAFILSNFMTLALSVWPRECWADGRMIANDGLLLLQAPFLSRRAVETWHAQCILMEALECLERNHPDEARRWIERGLATYPDDPSIRHGMGMVLLGLRQYAQARELFLKLLSEGDEPSEWHANCHNNIAWADLLANKPELYAEVDECSKKAYDALPWLPNVKCTRGIALVAIGRQDEALPLLEKAFEQFESTNDHALNACCLAAVFARRGDAEQAQKYTAQARGLDPECPLVAWAEQSVDEFAAGIN